MSNRFLFQFAFTYLIPISYSSEIIRSQIYFLKHLSDGGFVGEDNRHGGDVAGCGSQVCSRTFLFRSSFFLLDSSIVRFQSTSPRRFVWLFKIMMNRDSICRNLCGLVCINWCLEGEEMEDSTGCDFWKIFEEAFFCAAFNGY